MRTLAEDGISPLPEDHEAISQLTGQAEHGTLKPVVVLKLIDRREAAETLGIGLSNFKKLEGEGAFPFKRKMVRYGHSPQANDVSFGRNTPLLIAYCARFANASKRRKS